jgi:hypothetical protein
MGDWERLAEGNTAVLTALRVGATGGDIAAVRTGSVVVDFPAGSGTVGDIVEVDVTITGVADGDIVVMAPSLAVAADILWAVVRVTTDTVRLRATQGTASQDGASTAFNYLWFDLT